MSDPQHLGLGELGQRLQAMGDPAPQPAPPLAQVPAAAQTGSPVSSAAPGPGIDSRLRPYQGAPLPNGQLTNFSPNSNSISGTGSSVGSAQAPYPAVLSESRPDPRLDLRPEARIAQSAPTSAASSYNGQSFESLRPFGGSAPVSGPPPTLPTEPRPPAVSPWEQVAAPAASGPDKLAKELNPLESIGAGQPASSVGAGSAYSAGGSGSSLSSTNAGSSSESKSGLHRALNAVRSTIPLVQRLLPLLEGNFANAIGALMNPQHPAPPPVQVDLEPVERGLAEVRNSNRELRAQFQEQGTTLKRVEDQLERVREATDRNTLEQQELVEDLRAVGSRISTFAIIGVVLLLISLGLNIYFLIELQHILR